MLRREQLAHDPELLAMLDSHSTFRWIGASRHIIVRRPAHPHISLVLNESLSIQAYPISGHTIFNISTAQPDTNFAAEPTAAWTTRADKATMCALYADFCPAVRRMLGLVTESEVCEWKLRVHRPLRTWVEGHVALLGDACHPTLPVRLRPATFGPDRS
jgi:salicylate hydroxylase